MASNGLSNIQLELLRLYGNNVSDDTLVEIKKLLARFFADRASDAMNEVIEANNLSPADLASFANQHERAESRR